MILADKINKLRRENGWSQEELAEKLEVSRQSVSKWESGNSIPDLNKIIRMSEIFGVSTDYLIKDELEKSEPVEDTDDVRHVSVEEANTFMSLVRATAHKTALGVALCIMSPVVLLGLAGYGQIHNGTDSTLIAIGLGVLIIMVAIGVLLLVNNSMKLSNYKYLEEEDFTTDYGVSGIVSKKKQEFADTYRRCIAIGVVLCIVACVPLVVVSGAGFDEGFSVMCVSLLLFLVACGVFLFCRAGSINSSFDKLLQENDYTKENKKISKKTEPFVGAYWLVVTAVYLGASFITDMWDKTWIVWPVAGVLFSVVYAGVRALTKSRDNK